RFGEEPGLVRCLAFAPDGKTIAVGSERQGITFWDPATGKKQSAIKTAQPPMGLFYTQDGKSVVANSGERGATEVWEVTTGKRRSSFGGYPDYGVHLVLAPDSRLLVSTGPEHAVVVRELATGEVRRRLKGHLEQICGLAFGPSSRLLVSASRDTTGLVWDIYAPLEVQPPLTTLWADLGADAARAHAAIVAALAKPDAAVAALKEKLLPAEEPKPEALRRLIEQLVDDKPEVRERAAAELVHLDELAESDLRRVLEGGPAPQLR